MQAKYQLIKKSKSITICCNSFPPEKGGAPTRIYNLAKLLSEGGYRVTVITAMPNYPTGAIFPEYRGRLISKEKIDDINVVRLWMIPSNAANILIRAFSIITYLCTFLWMAGPRLIFGKADAVIISSPPLVNAWLAAMIARLGRKKIIFNISDIWPLTATEMGALKDGFIFRSLQKMERQLYRKAIAFTGQSQEILEHIYKTKAHSKPTFLYRNLQDEPITSRGKAYVQGAARFIYAGNLGHAQGILELCRQVDPSSINTTLDIFGDGAERAEIEQLILQQPDRGITLHPTVTQKELNIRLPQYAAIIIPLKTAIEGAVPSKLFMAIANNIPVIFCSGGEGAGIVDKYQLGLVNAPGDYIELQKNMQRLSAMSTDNYGQILVNIKKAGEQYFSKAVQDDCYLAFLKGII